VPTKKSSITRPCVYRYFSYLLQQAARFRRIAYERVRHPIRRLQRRWRPMSLRHAVSPVADAVDLSTQSGETSQCRRSYFLPACRRAHKLFRSSSAVRAERSQLLQRRRLGRCGTATPGVAAPRRQSIEFLRVMCRARRGLIYGRRSPAWARGSPFPLFSFVHSLPDILLFVLLFPIFLFSFALPIFFFCPPRPFL